MRARRLRTAPAAPRAHSGPNGTAAPGTALRLDQSKADGWVLAQLLIPGLGKGERGRLSRELGVTLAPRDPITLDEREAENDAILAACRAKLSSLELPALQQLSRIFAGSRLPEALVIESVFREAARSAFTDAAASVDRGAAREEELLAPLPPNAPSLQPAKRPRPIDAAAIQAALGPGGAVAKALPGYEPRPGQMKMARAVAKSLNEQLHLVVEAGTGTGKALDVDTPIPTVDGWKKMGDLAVGDMVFDEDGRPTRVAAAFDEMHGRPCFEISFSDGASLIADAEHEWITYTHRDRKWAARPRGSKYKGKHFITRAELAYLRARCETIRFEEFRSLRAASQFVGGHIWTVREAAESLVAPGVSNRPRSVPAGPLVRSVIERLERDVEEQRRDCAPFSIVTTQQLASTLTVGTAAKRLNHAVPVAGALDLPKAKLPLHPYFLGVWLGDGNSRNNQITSADPQVLEEIKCCGYGPRKLPSGRYLYAVDDERGKARSRWQPGMTGKLRRLSLIQNKHVPGAYLRASIQQRRDLLAGLLDTDGTVSRTGAIEFTTTSARLAIDVRELIGSLGYRVNVRQGSARLRGKDCGPKWTLSFTTPDNVFRLVRKQAAHVVRLRSNGRERTRFRYVVAVKPVASRPVRCIQVDSPSHLYLAGRSFVPTHNSLAYLVPSVEYATANGKRVVVSTNTINLQEQLFFKDLPLVRQAISTPFRAAVLKGRANYLCLRRWRSFLREGLSSDPDRVFAAKVLLWLRVTETGDRNELALDDHESMRWSTALAADALHCTAALCRDNRLGRCFLSRARRQAEAAHILVVNHALLLADQALESKVLPEYGDLILDEAHHLEDTATDQLGTDVDQQDLSFFLASLSLAQGPGRYAGLVSRAHTVMITAGGAPLRESAGEISQPAHDAIEAARLATHGFFNAVIDFARTVSEGPTMGERDIRLVAGLRALPQWNAVGEAWEPLAQAMGHAESAIERLEEALEPYKGSSDMVDDTLADLAGAQQQVTEVRISLSNIVAHPHKDEVYWVALRDRGVSLRAAPLLVGPLLQENLFSQKDCVVLTSATIQVGGSFRHIRERLGLTPQTFSLAVPSPFDYPHQALLCVPDDLPEPTVRQFGEASHEALFQVCAATRGRTLILFTSHAALRAAHEFLRRRLRGVSVLGQGVDGPRQQLLQRFRESTGCILLGTSSFWEGIDVVGDALSCLVIVKLPFSVPTDPVIAARSELYQDPFSEYAIPQAILRLKQGFGRLIRSTTDRGAVVILDSRLFTKRYGQTFLQALPPATRQRCKSSELGQIVSSWLGAAAAR